MSRKVYATRSGRIYPGDSGGTAEFRDDFTGVIAPAPALSVFAEPSPFVGIYSELLASKPWSRRWSQVREITWVSPAVFERLAEALAEDHKELGSADLL